jgi:hypothetical protein
MCINATLLYVNATLLDVNVEGETYKGGSRPEA